MMTENEEDKAGSKEDNGSDSQHHINKTTDQK